MSPYSPLELLNLVDKALSTDEAIPEELADQFLEIFSPDRQVLLMHRALQLVTPFTQEDVPCPPPIAPLTTT